MESDDKSGGLILMWHEDYFSVEDHLCHKNYILAMDKIMGRYDIWWCMGGDFNYVCGDDERIVEIQELEMQWQQDGVESGVKEDVMRKRIELWLLYRDEEFFVNTTYGLFKVGNGRSS
ncbi:Uncharacterized protein TCM_024781 [Theobroma cacao]|uniref:Uncharacterized protein n=1 Tax=Theobroma cacao TaxID=3641 RepID=A0A061F495_THECC|nr:Uncharacterized protein TCM_024781 [Theobroma cacao]